MDTEVHFSNPLEAESGGFEASLSYIVRPCLKETQQQQQNKKKQIINKQATV